jgi:hypothetical protein
MLAFAAVCAALGSLKLSDAARLYARHSLADEAVIVNAENQPRISAGLSWPTLQLELDYEPRLTLVDLFGSEPSPVLWLHSGAAQIWLRQPRYTLRLSQTGTWGDQEFMPFATSEELQSAPAPPTANQPLGPMGARPTVPAVNLLPNVRSLRVAAEDTTADLTVSLTRRWHADTRASYGFSGGADNLARMFSPRQRRAELDNSIAFDWSRRDQLSTVLTGARLDISNGYEHWLASLSEDWAARWSAATGSLIGMGIAFQDSTAPDRTTAAHWGPIGSADLTHALLLEDVRMHLQIGVGYAPEVNVLLGNLQNRLQFTSSASAAKGRWSVNLTLAWLQTVPANAPYAANVASAALAFEYEVRKWLGAQLGGHIVQQKLTSLIGTTGGMWLLYAGIVAHAPERRF